MIVALISTSIPIYLNRDHQSTHTNVSKVLPAISVTPGIAHLDQIVQVQMSNFSPSAQIRLTHDVQESVRTDTTLLLSHWGATGKGVVRIFVDDSWAPGSHLIQVEDIKMHFIASTVLQVLNDHPLLAPNLFVSRSGVTTALKGLLNMGSDEQGANTLQSLVLRNRGGGWISWSAVCNQPWLITSPHQGIFRNGQNIFIATDGGTDPASQILKINNPGSQPLTWLSASITSGTVFPNKNAGVQLQIHSNNLLPSVYSALLTFTSGLDTLNAPQTVAVSLTIQPRCGIATNLGNMSFTSFTHADDKILI
jgi:hypothetical protein